ncbi:SWIM zinc finger family protein [Natronoarchaeum sp. GCM10025703]|uniref:SWIM zinc finger family protein n=1 Tax=unclassified Natronoarchaeum TaxID=2620183 RepID=UPI0036162227
MSVPLSELDATSRVIKRAQYEAFEFTVEDDGVRVRNGSHANPEDHEYLVTLEGGLPTGCECLADANYESACKHRVAVAIRRPILDAAVDRQLAADGGKPRSTSEPAGDTPDSSPPRASQVSTDRSQTTAEEDDTSEGDGSDTGCVCTALPDGLPCWECVRTGRREVPNRQNTEQ